MKICTLVREIVETGYLTVADEEKLRQLLSTKYDLEDLNAFMQLQQSAMTGHIRQQSREERRCTLAQSGK